jgi:hypothetical protein
MKHPGFKAGLNAPLFAVFCNKILTSAFVTEYHFRNFDRRRLAEVPHQSAELPDKSLFRKRLPHASSGR